MRRPRIADSKWGLGLLSYEGLSLPVRIAIVDDGNATASRAIESKSGLRRRNESEPRLEIIEGLILLLIRERPSVKTQSDGLVERVKHQTAPGKKEDRCRSSVEEDHEGRGGHKVGGAGKFPLTRPLCP
jgi:hypothetical protein